MSEHRTSPFPSASISRPVRLALVPVFVFVFGLGALVQAAPLGVTADLLGSGLQDEYVLETDPDHDTLTANLSVRIRRQQLGAAAASVVFRFRVTLTPTAGGRPYQTSATVNYLMNGVHDEVVSPSVELDPPGWLRDDTGYTMDVEVFHIEDPDLFALVADDSGQVVYPRLAHFSGVLSFGALATSLDEIGESPPPQFLGGGRWSLEVVEGSLPSGFTFMSGPNSTPSLTAVRDSATGDLSVLSGSVEVDDGDGLFSWGEAVGRRGVVLITADGIAAQSFSLDLPPGLGWRDGGQGPLRPAFHSGTVALPLDPELDVARTVRGAVPAGREFVSSCLPVGFSPSSFTFDGSVLTFATPRTRFLRHDRFQQHLGLTGSLPRSNDSYLFHLGTDALGDLVVRPGPAGGITVDLEVEAGDYTAHFPDGDVGGTGATVRIVNGEIDARTSRVTADWIHLQYNQSCPLLGTESKQGMRIVDPVVELTAQGGLVASGLLATDAQFPGIERHLVAGLNEDTLSVHETDPFTEASFYMPGFCAPDEGAAQEANPARFMLAEVDRADGHALGYPGTAAYAEGAGLYAGFNFFHFAGLQVSSRIGGESPLVYPLREQAKAYSRCSGVSGVIEADPAALPFPTTIYGFPISFNEWGFNLLSNEMLDSFIDGQVDLSGTHAGFVQGMEEVRINCCGNLEDFEVPDGFSDFHQLSYWSGQRFDYSAVRFETPTDCADDRAALTYAATATLNGLPGEKAGYLRFVSTGSNVGMTLPSDPDFEASGLTLLPQDGVHGQYYFWPVGPAYFNNPEVSGASEGFVSFHGDLDVAFFKNMRVRGLTQANPAAPADRLFHYFHGDFLSGGESDDAHAGLPAGETIEGYQASVSNRPRARGSFFAKQDTFDFPVVFSSPTGNFYSAEDKELEILIIETASGVDRLNSKLAQIHFGLEINGLVELSVGNLIEEATEYGAQGLAGVVTPEITGPIEDGLLGLAETLDHRLQTLLEPALEAAILPDLVAPLAEDVRALGSGWTGDQATLDAVLNPYFGDLADPFDGGLLGDVLDGFERFDDGLGEVRGVIAEVDARLEQLQQALDCAVALMGGDLGQHGEALTDLFNYLVSELELNPDVGAIQGTPVYDEALDSLLASSSLGWLSDAREALAELAEVVEEVREVLAQGEEFFEEIQAVFDDVTTVLQAVNSIRFELRARIIAELSFDVEEFTLPEIEELISGVICNGFFDSLLSVNLQSILRARFSYLDTAVQEALTLAFQAVTDAILEALEESGALDGIQDLLSAGENLLGMLSVVKSIGFSGEAMTCDDRIRQACARSNVDFGIPTPIGLTIPMEVDSLFKFVERRSDGSSVCEGPAGATLPEVILTASGGSAIGFGVDSTVSIGTKFTFDEFFVPTGFAGVFEIEQSSFGVSGMGLTEFSGTLALGGPEPGVLREYYLGAFARGQFGLGGLDVALEGGFWVGQTCSPSPFAFYPNFPHLPDGNPVRGMAAYMSGKAPLIGGTCLLDVTIGAGIGGFLLGNEDQELLIGGLLEGSISGEMLCLAKAEGSMGLNYNYLGSGENYGGGTHLFTGSADAKLRLGRKPFAIEKSVSLDVEYTKLPGQSGDWQVNP